MERMKILIVSCIFLFSIITPSTQGVNTIEGNIITVDNEGDGDYTSIKEALNNANPGDTIEVYSGTYYERGLEVDKERITFQGVPYELGNGSDIGKPSILGNGTNRVFLFDSNNTIIDGFHIENGGGTELFTIFTGTDNSSGCIISNNTLDHSTSAIIWTEGSQYKIINNIINHSGMYSSIGLRNPCNNCLVSGNIISNAKDGIFLWTSGHHTIIGNKITNCSEFGIHVADGDFTEIRGNSIENNDYGIYMIGADNIVIQNNNLIDNNVNARIIFEIPGLIGMIKSNEFNGNYWDNYIGIGPKLIWGIVWLLPIAVFDIDWHPAKEPYDI